MRRFLLAAVLVFGGCAQPPESSTAPGPGDVMLAAVGTPFLIAVKIPLCAATLALAGPFGAVSEASDPDTPFGHDLRQGLSDGIVQNCGPPYAVTP